MADESQFTAAPVDLANGIGANNEVVPASTDDMYQQAFDPKQQQLLNQGTQVKSLLNAASPTPLGKSVNPSIAKTLSNLGKVEPEQLAQSSIALDGVQVPQAPPLPEYAMQAAPQAGVSATTIAGASSQLSPMDAMANSVDAAFAQQQGANNTIAKATVAKSVADQTQFDEAEKEYAKAEVKRAEVKMKFDADYGAKMASYEQSVEDYKQAAGDKVIPGRLLANMETGQRIQSGLFMALSAYGSALSGQENQALKVINNAIDKDVDAQRFNIENKLKGARMGVEGSQYMMSQMRAKFGDDVSATLATKDAMLAMTQQKLNVNASKLEQATAGPKAQALNAQIDMQRQQIKAQLQQAQAQAYMLQQIQGSGKHVLSDAELNVMESVQKGYRDRHVQGYGQAANGEQAKKFTEYASEVGPAIDGLDRIKELAKNYNKFLPSEKKSAIETEMAGVVGALRIPITGPGILTDSEREMLKTIVGNPSVIFSLQGLQRAKLNAIYGKLQNDLSKRGKIAGLPEDSFKKSSSSKYFLD